MMVTFNATTATMTGTTLDLGTGAATEELSIGDTLMISMKNAAHSVTQAEEFTVNGVTDDDTVILSGSFGTDPIATEILSIIAVPASVQSTRAAVCASDSVELVMKPALSFLQHSKLIPLSYIKQGLSLHLQLERPEHAINNGGMPSSGNTPQTYEISNVRYVASMVTPDESIIRQYEQMFKSASGIPYTFLSYRHRQTTISDTTGFVANMHFGIRSARHVFSIIQSQRLSEATGAAAQNNNSISASFRALATEYQYKVGSEEYPHHSVKMASEAGSAVDLYSMEAMAQVDLAFNQHGSTLWCRRSCPADWASVNSYVTAATDAGLVNTYMTGLEKTFMFATRLDRDSSSPFTGVDLSVVPLDLDLTFSGSEVGAGGFGNRILHTWVGHDELLTISSDGIIVRV
jgi:hypothetical protein